MIPWVRAEADGAGRRPAATTAEILNPPATATSTAWLLGIVLAALWTWWAISDGAFFGTVMLPGTIALGLALIIVAVYVPHPLSTRGPHALAVAALIGLGIWTALSITWSAAPDLALENAQRVFVYVGAYIAGLLLAIALRRRLILSLLPLLAAAAFVAAVILIKIWVADSAGGFVDGEGTLDYPFGYRNANASFFVISGLVSVAVLARVRSPALVRGGAAALASASFAIAAISQSRGSLIGLAVGAIFLVVAAPTRGRALLSLTIGLVPVAVLFAELVGPYDAASDALPVLPELQGAATAVLAAAFVAGLVGAAWAIIERRAPRGPEVPLPSRRTGLALCAAAVLAAAALIVGLAGSPGDWLDSGGDDSAEVQAEATGSRYTYSGNLNRSDFWRVALLQFGDAPINGEGSGSFRTRYLLERDTSEAPREAHSLPLETLGELGAIGLALLLAALLGMAGGALRSRRLGPEAATVATAAIAAGAAWFAQSSVDWFWAFAGLSAPVIALLGSAAAPGALALSRLSPAVTRSGVVIAAIISAIAIPTFAADRLTLNAAKGWRDDVDGAYRALDAASDLDPVSDLPDLVKAEIARQTGDTALALASIEEARRRQPDEFQNYLLAAELLETSDPDRALQEAQQAVALNPRSKQANAIVERLSESDEDTRGQGGKTSPESP